MGMNSQLTQQPSQSQCTSQKTRKIAKIKVSQFLETKAYPDFKFNHMFSMLVVGPSQCGKTYFVEQLLTNNCVKYPSKKPRRIYRFYNQWQPRYVSLKSTLGDEIQFTQGLPALSEDLSEIGSKFNNVVVFDDLMSEATDSSVLSKLFTQGRHHNASTILLFQNISRNAQYMVLFRSPSDRKQIAIIAERIFAKDRPNFMQVYAKETEKPYGYVLVDNQPKTTTDKQVVSNVFGSCHSYPHITTSTKILQVKEINLGNQAPDVNSANQTSKISLCTPIPQKRCIDQPQAEMTHMTSVKCKVNTQPPVKKTRKQSKLAKKQAKAKQQVKARKKRIQTKRTKPYVYKPKFIISRTRETLSSDEISLAMSRTNRWILQPPSRTNLLQLLDNTKDSVLKSCTNNQEHIVISFSIKRVFKNLHTVSTSFVY